MNMLEVFNKVEAHLLAQGVRSKSYSDACAYRGEMGRMCAIGCLIKDGAYHKGLEGIPMWADEKEEDRQMLLEEALIKSGIDLNPATTYMLSDLQSLHDTVRPEVWKQRLQKLRVKYFGIDTSKTCDEKTAIDRHNNQWVGLTHEEKHYLNDVLNLQGRFSIIDAIESKLKDKNIERQKGE